MLYHKPDTPGKTGAGEFMDALARLFAKAAGIEREPVDTGDGKLLYTSEVHVIDMAGRFPDESMTSIASRLGITKGAVSQTVKKLEERGYLERYCREGDNRTVYIRLTPAGDRAFFWHATYHDRVNGRLEGVIASLTDDERERMITLLGSLEKIFDDCPELRNVVTESLRDAGQTR